MTVQEQRRRANLHRPINFLQKIASFYRLPLKPIYKRHRHPVGKYNKNTQSQSYGTRNPFFHSLSPINSLYRLKPKIFLNHSRCSIFASLYPSSIRHGAIKIVKIQFLILICRFPRDICIQTVVNINGLSG